MSLSKITYLDTKNLMYGEQAMLDQVRKHYDDPDRAFNTPPRGMTEITEDQLIRETPFSGYSPQLQEYKQFKLLDSTGKEYFTGAQIFYYHNGTGVVMVSSYWAKPAKLRWFRFGCQHVMKHVSNDGTCLNTHRCEKCGWTQQIDSSD